MGRTQTEQPVLEEERRSSVDWWSPPRSPFGLLEEILWSDEWKLLVACMMLNCTTRLQVDRVLWRLFLLVPTPEDAVALGASGDGGDGFDGKSGLDRIEEILRPLGLHRKRARALVKLSEDYVAARGAAALPGPPGATGSDDDDDDGGGGRGSLGGFSGVLVGLARRWLRFTAWARTPRTRTRCSARARWGWRPGITRCVGGTRGRWNEERASAGNEGRRGVESLPVVTTLTRKVPKDRQRESSR